MRYGRLATTAMLWLKKKLMISTTLHAANAEILRQLRCDYVPHLQQLCIRVDAAALDADPATISAPSCGFSLRVKNYRCHCTCACRRSTLVCLDACGSIVAPIPR